MRLLYTIGYEGKSIDEFIQLIINNNIKTLIDVRELAISRRPGFAKTKLKSALENKDVAYYHIPSLGSPKDVRHKLREDHDYATFFQSYRYHACLMLDDVMRVTEIAEKENTCLLCYEHNPLECHRSVLAEMITKYSRIIDKVVDIS